MTNKKCKVRREIINVNSDEPVFHLFSIKTSKYSGSCNNINDPYAKMCVPGVVKNVNVKVFNLMSRTNETRHIEWHKMCKYKCSPDASVYNNKQRCNDDKCRCEYKKLIEKGVCDKGSFWNPSNCECECDKSWDVGEYLDYENCKCRKRLADKLVERYTKNIEESILVKITSTENDDLIIKLINGKSQTNRDQKSNLLFLQGHDKSQKNWIKLVKNRQKTLKKHWYLLHWIHYN